MDKSQFYDHYLVSEFVDWLSVEINTLKATIKLPKSRYVPTLVEKKCAGFDEILDCYTWKNKWEDPQSNNIYESKDWNTTRDSLYNLSNMLINAIKCEDEKLLFQYAICVVEWGGDTSSREPGKERGARKDLNHLYQKSNFWHTFRKLTKFFVNLISKIYTRLNIIMQCGQRFMLCYRKKVCPYMIVG